MQRSLIYRALFGAFLPLYAAPEGGGAAVSAFKATKHVTLPTLSLKDAGTIVHLRFESPIRQGKNINPDDPKEPAHVATVLNLDTGELQQIVLAKQLRGTLEEEYPNDGYVGRIFELENLGKKKGGKSAEGYNVFKITEGEWPGDLPAVGAALSGTPRDAGEPKNSSKKKGK